MPLEESLRKVEYDISTGNYEKARQRLTGLLCHFAYPMNLQVRRMLGDNHWRNGNVIEAGRYWYLEQDKTPEMIAACTRFERACNHSGQTILRRLKLMGDIAKLRDASPYAFDLVQKLSDRAWSEFEDKYPAGIFYDSAQWYAQRDHQSRPKNHQILVIDAVGRLSKTAIGLNAKMYSSPNAENPFVIEYSVSTFTVAAPKLSQHIDETQIPRIRVEPLDLTTLDEKLTAITEKQGTFESAVVWLSDENLNAHETIAKYVEDYFHIVGAEKVDFQQPISIPYAAFKRFPHLCYHQTVLGWIVERDRTRWLTEDEIAAGIADAMLYRHIRWKIGTIRPWQNRPSEESRTIF